MRFSSMLELTLGTDGLYVDTRDWPFAVLQVIQELYINKKNMHCLQLN